MILFVSSKTKPNFSYNLVETFLVIPSGQQMIVYQNIDINDELQIDGELVLI
jgi:hypothetical protein